MWSTKGRKKKSWKEDQRILDKDIIPIWNRRKASDIKRKDVIHLLDSIVKRGAEIQANRTLAVVRRMFNFALERDILEFSPCNAVKAPGKENIKDRVLSDKELEGVAGGTGAGYPSALSGEWCFELGC